ncbi:MAG: hypothetical protein NTV51_01465 [Verrucomicrobia bacterium]|nr:hypothetical protein [Verrucomicrobiota bacterium]
MGNDSRTSGISVTAKPWEGVRDLMNRRAAALRDHFNEVHDQIESGRCPRDRPTIKATIKALARAKEEADKETLDDIGNPDRWFGWVAPGIILDTVAATNIFRDGYVFHPLWVVMFFAGTVMSIVGWNQYHSVRAKAKHIKRENDITAQYDKLIATLDAQIDPRQFFKMPDGRYRTDVLGHESDFDEIAGLSKQLDALSSPESRTDWIAVEHIKDTIARLEKRDMTEEYRQSLASLCGKAVSVRAEQDRVEAKPRAALPATDRPVRDCLAQ